MAEDKEIRNALISLGVTLEKDLADELVSQGHRLTGKLIASIEVKLASMIDKLQLEGKFEDYGIVVDTGVDASVVRSKLFNPGSGRKRSRYITGLINWARIKFSVDARKAKGIAFAIAHTHLKTGIPTSGERGKGWVSKTLVKNEKKIFNVMSKASEDQINVLIDNLIRNTEQIIRV